jgi:hypothetical protein
VISSTDRVLTRERGYHNPTEGTFTFWDGVEWALGVCRKSEPVKAYRLRLADGSSMIVSEDQQTLYWRREPGVWKTLENVKSLSLGKDVTTYECLLPRRSPRFNVLDAYDYGLLLAKLHGAEIDLDVMQIKVPEKDFSIISETQELLSKVTRVERDTIFRSSGNLEIFEFRDKELLNLKHLDFPLELYGSYEGLRGYLRGIFDRGKIRDAVYVKGKVAHLQEVREALKLFSIRSSIDKGLKIIDIHELMVKIGVRSLYMTENVHKVWRLDYKVRNIKINKITPLGKMELYNIVTETGAFLCNGFILQGAPNELRRTRE